MTKTSYRLIRVETTPAVCSECGRECRERHLVVVDEVGSEFRMGTTCAWTIAGVRSTDRAEIPVAGTPEESAEFILSWMNE